MINEFEQVVILEDLPDYDLKAGDLGTVVLIHGDHAGYELEIFSADGRTVAVVTAAAAQVRPVSHRDVLHVRERSA
jgi:hypothetical protein